MVTKRLRPNAKESEIHKTKIQKTSAVRTPRPVQQFKKPSATHQAILGRSSSTVVTIGNGKSCVVLSFRCQSCLSNSSASHQRCWPTVRNKDASFGIPPWLLSMEGHCHFQGQTFGESSLVTLVASVAKSKQVEPFWLFTWKHWWNLSPSKTSGYCSSRSLESTLQCLCLSSKVQQNENSELNFQDTEANELPFCVPETKELNHLLQERGKLLNKPWPCTFLTSSAHRQRGRTRMYWAGERSKSGVALAWTPHTQHTTG